MTLAAVRPKTIVVGVTDTGHRCSEDHHNYNGRITQVIVDALRELHEDYGRLIQKRLSEKSFARLKLDE